MRSKGNNYKSKRQEIAELQAEFVTLKRTEEIIKKKFDEVKDHLVTNLFFRKNFLNFVLNLSPLTKDLMMSQKI